MENTTCVKPPTSQTFYSSHGRSQRRNGGRSVATLGPMPCRPIIEGLKLILISTHALNDISDCWRSLSTVQLQKGRGSAFH